jgi:hypothetical protein
MNKKCSTCQGLSLSQKDQELNFKLTGLKRKHWCTIHREPLEHSINHPEFIRLTACTAKEKKESDIISAQFSTFDGRFKKLEKCVLMGKNCQPCLNRKKRSMVSCNEFLKKIGNI